MRDAALPWIVVGSGTLAAVAWGERNARASTPRRRRAALPPGVWVWPVPTFQGRAPVISDGWGSARDGGRRLHLGVDVMFRRRTRNDLVAELPPGSPNGSKWHFMPDGVEALAIADGTVWSAGWTATGFTVVLEHAGGWTSIYRHLELLLVTPTLRRRSGEHVAAGQPLGIVGASPVDREALKHLHFELHLRGRPVDPTPHLARWAAIADDAGALRNGGLVYRSVGARGEPYPAWVRELRGQSGVYVIREDGEVVYVGQSSAGKLYETLTRHLQTWRRWKGFWRGQYGEGHDPGLTYARERVEVAVRITDPDDALDEEARLIARLRPRDNLLGQPEEPIPF